MLTRDAALVDVLRGSAPELDLASAASPGDLADLLLSRSCRALVVDAALVGAVMPALVEKLARQFPELPLVAVGARTDEAALARLLSGGVLYRFLHRPVSPERARAFLAAALRRSGELARTPKQGDAAAPPSTVASGPRGRAPATATPPSAGEMATPSPRSRAAPAATAPERAPPARGAASFLPGRDTVERSDRRGALLLGALVLVAAAAGFALHDSDLAHAPQVAASAPAPADLVAAAGDAEARGALVTPIGRSAVDFYREALERSPGDTIARDRLLALAPRLLALADAALAGGRYDEADAAARAVALVSPERVDVRALVERIELARTSGTHAPAGPRPDAARASSTVRPGMPPARTRAKTSDAPAQVASTATTTATPATTPTAIATAMATPETPPIDAAPVGDTVASESSDAPAPAPGGPAAETSGGAAALAAAPPRAAVIPPPHKLVDAPPDYPARARAKNVEGWVDVTFTIATSGVPENVRVMAAQPTGVFDEAAVAAVRRWRYAPPDAPRDTNVRVRFRLDR